MPHPENYSPDFAPDGFVSAAEEAWEDRANEIREGCAALRKETTTEAFCRIAEQAFAKMGELTGDQADEWRESARELFGGTLDALALEAERVTGVE